jgi:D-alanine-D-alanine ligase
MGKRTLGFVYDCQEDYLAQGFTQEQVAEFDPRETVEAIAAGLAACGWEVTLVGNGRALALALASGKRYDLVFNIAEGVAGFSREAQVPALCELFQQKYTFSDPLACALTLHKAKAKQVIAAAGLPTARFFLVSGPEDLERPRSPGPTSPRRWRKGPPRGSAARAWRPTSRPWPPPATSSWRALPSRC